MSSEAKKQGQMKTRAFWGVAVLAVVGAILLWKGKTWFYAPWVLAVYLLCGILFFRGLLTPIDKVVQGLSYGIMWALSRAVLVLVYYLMITPLGLWFRLTGRDRLNLKKKGNPKSFWKKRPPEEQRPDCEKQY